MDVSEGDVSEQEASEQEPSEVFTWPVEVEPPPRPRRRPRAAVRELEGPGNWRRGSAAVRSAQASWGMEDDQWT